MIIITMYRVGQQMPRVLVLLFSLCMMTMLFVAKFGLYLDGQFRNEGNLEFSSKQPSDIDDEIHKKYKTEVNLLQEKIRHLESILETTDKKAQNLSNQISHQTLMIRSLQEYRNSTELQKAAPSSSSNYSSKVKTAEILHGVALKSEYEIIPFTKFTLNKIFLVEPGLGKRVVEKPIGYKKKDILNVLSFALNELNGNRTTKDKKFVVEDFIEGMYRTEPLTGTQYELYFRDIDAPHKHTYRKITVMRPFDVLHSVRHELKNTTKSWINLILPLKGRIDAFRQFMNRFVKTVIYQDRRVYLTVVYFGQEDLNTVKEIMTSTAKEHKYKHMKLVTLKEEFSRGRGLQVGVLSWKSGDVLLFLCDVDIVFSSDFLERCRVNTEQGRRVYYPIVFSLYNPSVVYSLQDMVIPNEREQLVISRSTGFWRDFGYGMTCQYRSDFKSVNGFDEYISGWGGEDVFLYQKYVRTDFMVIRATDPGLFHLWHEKTCDPKLNSMQYQSCIRSKALNEASHDQLGLLAFKDEINAHKKLTKNNTMAIPTIGSMDGPNGARNMDQYPPEA
ncbi:Chondroitin sulfate N-acetylgalactosaminyltransferase 1 [Mactra antiquata]